MPLMKLVVPSIGSTSQRYSGSVPVDGREFLAGKTPVRIAREQVLSDQELRLLVGLRDEIGRPLDADLELAEPLEIAERQRAGLAGDGDHVG